MQGDEHRWLASRVNPEKAGSRDSDNGERHVVDLHRLSDGVRIGREAPLPVFVADHGHWRGAGAVILVCDQTSGGGRNAEAAVKPTRYVQPIGDFRLSTGNDIDFPRGGVREQSGQFVTLRAKKLVGGVRVVRAGDRAGLAIPVPAAVLTVNYRRAAFRAPV